MAIGDWYVYDGKVQSGSVKWYYSQDCVTWVDLEPCEAAQKEKALTLTSMLSGDLAKVFTVYEEQPLPEPEPVPEPAEGEEAVEPEAPEPLPPLEFPVTELERLAAMVSTLGRSCPVHPKGAYVVNAKNLAVPSELFAGLAYPDKLESYVNGFLDSHPTLASAVPGTWSLAYDAFAQTAVIKSLAFPGFCSYFNNAEKTYGNLYFGSGLPNADLAFMV
mmetsp:Transcript_14854/g.48675  ORF Transcript_14854/g.48675 Transcript_14854/m.48675 type:complete len:218 (+) Transcript_14854:210-863(+)